MEQVSNAANAAFYARTATAAYYDDEVRHAVQRRRFCRRHPNAYWWRHENASGVVWGNHSHLVIGIAGTNDFRDVRSGLDVAPQRVREWEEIYGAPVRCSSDVQTTAGFLAYAGLCWREIGRRNLGDTRSVVLVGHSLGAAAAAILQCTDMFSDATAYLYGCPNVFRGQHEAKRVSIRRVTDPVVYLPAGYQQPSADTYYVRYPGSLRKSIPWHLKPLAAVLAIASWARLSFRGHSMLKYREDLQPLLAPAATICYSPSPSHCVTDEL